MSRCFDHAAATEIPDGEARAYEVGDLKICVIAHEGCHYAVADLCTHGHAFLSEGYCDAAEGVIECPLHGGLFDFRTGKATGAPAEKDVATFPIAVVDGRLMLNAPETSGG